MNAWAGILHVARGRETVALQSLANLVELQAQSGEDVLLVELAL